MRLIALFANTPRPSDRRPEEFGQTTRPGEAVWASVTRSRFVLTTAYYVLSLLSRDMDSPHPGLRETHDRRRISLNRIRVQNEGAQFVPTAYVLIDFENVQPKNLEILANRSFNVVVFVGANQTKIPSDLAIALQALGEQAKYIRISGNGRNALDFHMAFYAGELSARSPSAHFYIVSKDTGFDPLIKHLKGKNIHAQRVKDLTELAAPSISKATNKETTLEAVIKNLTDRGQSRPRTVKTLVNTINSVFKVGGPKAQSLVKELEVGRYIEVKQGKVSYKLS